MNSYYDSQPPANSYPVSKADAFAKRARKMAQQQAIDDTPRAPEPSARYREDMENFDRMNEVPNEVASGQNSWRQGIIHAGHISDSQAAANANEKNINWSQRHAANAYSTKRAQLQSQLSDRDVEWAERKEDRAYERSQGDRRWAAEQEATKYSREQDALNRTDKNRSERILIAQGMIRSDDEVTQIEGHEMMQAILDEDRAKAGPSAAPAPGAKAAAFIQQTQQPPGTMPYRPGAGADGEKVMPYSPGAPATARQNDPVPAAPAPSATAPGVRSQNPRVAQVIADREQRRKLEAEGAARAGKLQDLQINNAEFVAADNRRRETNQVSTADLRGQLARLPDDEIEKRNELLRQIAEVEGGKPIAPGTYAPSADQIARRDHTRKQESRQRENESLDTALNDPPIAAEITNITQDIASIKRKEAGGWMGIGDVPTTEAHAQGIIDKIDAISQQMAEAHGIAPEVARQRIMQQIRTGILADDDGEFTEGQELLRGKLSAPQQPRVVSPFDLAKFPGAKANRFAQRM